MKPSSEVGSTVLEHKCTGRGKAACWTGSYGPVRFLLLLQRVLAFNFELNSVSSTSFLIFQVTFVLLLPGLNQHGIILKYIGMAKREINKLLKQKEKKNE